MIASRLARYALLLTLLGACSPTGAAPGITTEEAIAATVVAPSVAAAEVERVPDPLVTDPLWVCSDVDIDVERERGDCLSRRSRALIGALDAQFATLQRRGSLAADDREDFRIEYEQLRDADICRRVGPSAAVIRCDIERLESLQNTMSRLSWLEVDDVPGLPHQMWGRPLSAFDGACEVQLVVAAADVDWLRIAERGFATDEDGNVTAAQVELTSTKELGPVRGTSSSSWETTAGEVVSMSFDLVGTHYYDGRYDVMAGVWFGQVEADLATSDIYGYWWLHFDDRMHGVGEIRNLEAGTFGEVLTAEVAPCE